MAAWMVCGELEGIADSKKLWYNITSVNRRSLTTISPISSTEETGGPGHYGGVGSAALCRERHRCL